jgi:very-short-patch-repair endonuclease
VIQRKKPLQARNTLENRLWAHLRTLEGYRFRKKSPFRTFLLDFVEHDAKLAISLEDSARRGNHIVRDRLLSGQGYVILRLWRHEAERDLSSALHRIKAVLEDLVG